jgi:hypothetical protein
MVFGSPGWLLPSDSLPQLNPFTTREDLDALENATGGDEQHTGFINILGTPPADDPHINDDSTDDSGGFDFSMIMMLIMMFMMMK